MTPAPGERLLRFVGDRLRFTVRTESGAPLPAGWRVLMRTNLGRASLLRHEIINSYPHRPPLAGAAWHDVPLEPCGNEWVRELTLTETGFFRAKAYAVDPQGFQHWPDGDDAGISVHADQYRTGNTIYCAFTRMFGESKTAKTTADPAMEARLAKLDARGYTVIPSSGKLRDLIRELPFIFDTLGCRILHLLPVHPTPTTFAKFGRFGSPYAAQDLTAVDPALVEFDKRTTGIDQFRELTYAAHAHGGRVFLDMVINHTGWGARLQETHPEWYLRDNGGSFVSPGAWGVTWEDLTELDHSNPGLWQELADVFLIWCRRGVDGFRCDAGYKVPIRAWRYITARVLEEYPETVFLLEGLGGSWEATELLITEGGMQWAYSELFQNHSGIEMASYLEYALRQTQRLGLYVHYSETHDNNRLAERGRDWSLLRNRLCALTSACGGFGFTCGVEWLAAEKINVHSSRGMSWGSQPNLVTELSQLNSVLREHPCFFDGATLTRVTAPDSVVYALLRESADADTRVVVVVNTDLDLEHLARFDPTLFAPVGRRTGTFEPAAVTDLLGQAVPPMHLSDGRVVFTIPPAAVYCLELRAAPTAAPVVTETPFAPPAKFGAADLSISADGKQGALQLQSGGAAYRQARAQAAWAITALSRVMPAEQIGPFNWRVLADWVNRDPKVVLAAIALLDPAGAQKDLLAALFAQIEKNCFPRVTTWQLLDARRVTPVPAGHWLLITDTRPFRANLAVAPAGSSAPARHIESIEVMAGHVACFPPCLIDGTGTLELERYADDHQRVTASLVFLPDPDRECPGGRASSRAALPTPPAAEKVVTALEEAFRATPLARQTGEGPGVRAHPVHPYRSTRPKSVLLTNGRGAMARLCVNLGHIESKYDCLLGANLHPEIPVDRHVFAKRVRVWMVADGFITPVNGDNLIEFEPGPPARWRFVCNAGNGRAVEVNITAEMLQGRDATVLRFHRPPHQPALGADLPEHARVALTVRVDIEDRNFHAETKHNGGSEYHFSSHTRPLPGGAGFEFTPAADRQLRVLVNPGAFHPQPEWCDNILHPVEASRAQEGAGDAYSPGWFEIPLARGGSAALKVSAELDAGWAHIPPPGAHAASAGQDVPALVSPSENRSGRATSPSLEANDPFAIALARAAREFVVRRGEGKTVIAGYPWFLDWGRDTLICVRGLIAAGLLDDVRDILITFARFEENGTLPNTIHGENASNRDTTDAPLWFGVACEEMGPDFSGTVVDRSGRSIADVLRSIAEGYLRGTPNGIRVDHESGLVWSPSHFTWMDTNYPAGTPREGYPVEIQVLWIRLLRQLDRLGMERGGSFSPQGGGGPGMRDSWSDLAARAEQSFRTLFWLDDAGYFADVLSCRSGTPAGSATVDTALRSNCLFAVSLGLVTGENARRCVESAAKYLIVPGALRSLAPLPVTPPLPIYSAGGQLLNDPLNPYWGRYEGDEDTRRKPAYHNGTAWTWTFPSFCEALALAWDRDPGAVTAARSCLLSLRRLMQTGCAGHLPEIVDGDAPHHFRGCDSQAWSATEALRVWKLLNQ